MKITVSIPDDVFNGAERLARCTKKSRSQLFSDALKEYVARHAPEEITEVMNAAWAKMGNPQDAFVSSATARLLRRSEGNLARRRVVGRSARSDRIRPEFSNWSRATR